MMKLMAENPEVIIVLVILVVGVIVYIIQQPKRVIEWLKYAVTVAEKELQSGTGQLKLRQVYDAFIRQFPKLSIFVSFSTFSKWVDIALEWLQKQMETNVNVQRIVKEGTGNEQS